MDSLFKGETAVAAGIKPLEGDAAIAYLKGENSSNGKKQLINAYHPGDEESQKMTNDFIKVAGEIKEKKLPFEVVTINMSKTDKSQSGFDTNRP